MSYRTESYIDYLKLHKSDVILNLKEKKNFILLILFLFLGFSAKSGSFEFVMTNLVFVIIFVVLGFGGVFYIFPMTLYYKVFKRSSEQYKAISQYVLKQKMNVKVNTKTSETSLVEMFKYNSDPISDKVDYNFERADVFETEHSLFIFPIRKLVSGKSKLYTTEYLPPLRFSKDTEEKIVGIYDLYTITEFDEKSESNDCTIKFKDKTYDYYVSLNIVDYTI